MYIPGHFREEDPQKIASFIRNYPFGVILSSVDDSIKGTHLPFLLEENNGQFTLISHLAAANDQIAHFRRSPETLVIFQGPDAYISPSLYAEQQNVPTWNFIAVHLYGSLELIEGFEEKLIILEDSIRRFDPAYFDQWKSLKPEYKNKLIGGMTGMRFTAHRTEAKYKLSQNRSEASRKNVLKHMEETKHPMADYMREEPNRAGLKKRRP